MAEEIRVLLLSPSAGLGGGIERYVETLQWAFRMRAIECTRMDLDRPGMVSHLRMLRLASSWRKGEERLVWVVATHRALLPVAMALRARRRVAGVSVICHGSDVWGPTLSPRWRLEKQLMVSPQVRVVAASSFTAGAVGVRCRATVLAPGLARSWFDELAAASDRKRPAGAGLRIATAFRLSDWRDKGLAQLLTAIRMLDRADVALTICGSGKPGQGFDDLIRGTPRCRVRSSLTDRELAEELASADLFVLATRTRSGGRPSGEGFGLVLLEAQMAGTPVVAPASGGSRDAFQDGVTGVAPVDESPAALAQVLDAMFKDRERLAEMGARATQWARARFDPDLYASQAVGQLVGIERD